MTAVSSASPGRARPGRNRLFGPLPDVQEEAGYADDHPARVGFFTDTSVCIGCKACEVACKEWNALPADGPHHDQPDLLELTATSYDNTGALGASTYRHVAFVEQTRTVDLPMPTFGRPGDDRQDSGPSPAESGSDVTPACWASKAGSGASESMMAASAAPMRS